jgi:hypothetical protein
VSRETLLPSGDNLKNTYFLVVINVTVIIVTVHFYKAISTLQSAFQREIFLSRGVRVGYMFGQIGLTGRKVRGHFGQIWAKFENFVRTKMMGFGKFWDQTLMGIILGPCHNPYIILYIYL